MSNAVPVAGKTLQALFDKLKRSHLELKDEVRELYRRCGYIAELMTLKSVLLQFPPLHNLNDILDGLSATPNLNLLRSTSSACNGVSPQLTSAAKRRSAPSIGVAAAKALKFSPHLLKKEPTTCDGKDYSTQGGLELLSADTSCKGEEDDDIIEIDGM